MSIILAALAWLNKLHDALQMLSVKNHFIERTQQSTDAWTVSPWREYLPEWLREWIMNPAIQIQWKMSFIDYNYDFSRNALVFY